MDNLAKAFKNNNFPSVQSPIPNYNKIISNIPKQPTSFTVGDIHVTCPGITSDDVAKQIGSALKREFSGMSLMATQKMSITR